MRDASIIVRTIRFCVGALACVATLANADIIVTDDAGHKLQRTAPATRIITLAPSLTELAFTAGAGAQVIAVSAYSDDPVAAKSLPVVADASGMNIEAVLALKPDLMIAWKSGNKTADLDRLRGFGIPVYVAEVTKMADVPRVLRDVGKLANTSATAEAAAQKFEGGIQQLRDTHAHKKNISVFFEIARQPLMTINGQHAIDEAITLCGGKNVFKAAPVLVFQPSIEALFAAEPAVILYTADADSRDAAPWQRYRGLRAFARGHVLRLTPNPILRPGSGMLQGATELCQKIDTARRGSER